MWRKWKSYKNLKEKLNAITVLIYNSRNRLAKRVTVKGYYNCGTMSECPTSEEKTDMIVSV